MKRKLVMELYSREPLDPVNTEAQITALSTFEGGLFKPEKCDVNEPVRERFDAKDIHEPVRWLSQPGGRFKFRKSKPPRIEGYISNLRFREIRTSDSKKGPWIPVKSRFPEPAFLTRWVVWLDAAAATRLGTAVLKRFLIKMFRVSMSEYGFLTTEEDHRKKNFKVTVEGASTVECYVGTDPAMGVPGIYWMNLFGPTYAAWLGKEKLERATGIHESLPEGSLFVQFGGVPETCSSPEIVRQQRDVIAALGEEKFFNIDDPERYIQTPFAPIGG